MKNFESNVQYIKYLVNKEMASRFFSGTLVKDPFLERDIAEAIIPGPRRCSAAVSIRKDISLKTVCILYWSLQKIIL